MRLARQFSPPSSRANTPHLLPGQPLFLGRVSALTSGVTGYWESSMNGTKTTLSKDCASRNSYLVLSLWTWINGWRFVQQAHVLKLAFLDRVAEPKYPPFVILPLLPTP